MSSPNASQKSLPAHILEELKDLKRENEKLRQETIHLLESSRNF